MTGITIRDTEACEPQPNLLWDSVWWQRLDAQGGYADWILAGPADQVESRGGLRAEASLHTATLILLFTDARLPADSTYKPDDGDRRGWWGESIKLDGEPDAAALGSLLWTLERSVLNAETARLAKEYAEDALAVLASQGMVARTEVETAVNTDFGRLELVVRHYAQDGTKAYEQRFDKLWGQELRPAKMNYGEKLVA